MTRPTITLLTDFGLSDHYVSAMKGVMLSICPEARFVDISHEVSAYSILGAAFTLSQAWRYFPEGTVHLIVVDPGVGSARRAIVAESNGHYFVAPDNGVLSMVGPLRAFEIRESRFCRRDVSSTFHGRDVFAPVAAHLATGITPTDVGPGIADLVRLSGLKPVEKDPGIWSGMILKIDRYGNIVTNFLADDYFGEHEAVKSHGFELELESNIISQYYPIYDAAPRDKLFFLRGSSGYIEVSINQGDAAARLNVREGALTVLRKPPVFVSTY